VNPQTSTDTNMFRGAVDTGWSTVVTAVGQFVAIGGSPLNDSYYQFTSTNAIVKLSGTGNFCGGALAPQTVTSSAQSFLEGLWQLCASGSWDYLPGASAGSRGTPILQAKGTFKSNQPIEFRVTNAPKDGTLFFMYSITAANLPLYGATLVPDITAPGSGILPLTADAKGEIKLPLTLPPGIPAGIKFYFQVWTLDSSGPNGYTATHGLVALSQ
jgi:hypothetical protein